MLCRLFRLLEYHSWNMSNVVVVGIYWATAMVSCCSFKPILFLLFTVFLLLLFSALFRFLSCFFVRFGHALATFFSFPTRNKKMSHWEQCACDPTREREKMKYGNMENATWKFHWNIDDRYELAQKAIDISFASMRFKLLSRSHFFPCVMRKCELVRTQLRFFIN